MSAVQDPFAFEKTEHLKYVRGPELSERSQQRSSKRKRELAAAAKGIRSLTGMGFSASRPPLESTQPTLSAAEALRKRQLDAIKVLEKKLQAGIRKVALVGQNLARHQAVLGFLKMQLSRQDGETREQMALSVARSHGRGLYFARKIVAWERTWLQSRMIEEGRKGCYTKSRSWLNDEGVQLAVREWLSGAKEAELTGYGLAKAIGKYLDSKRVEEVLCDSFGPGGNRIRARTARRWMKKMGFAYSTVQKGVYIDGHERQNVVEYRQSTFIPLWKTYERRFVIFHGDGTWELPQLPPGEIPIVFITHDESTFNANDGKRRLWMKKNTPPIRQKGRGKGIMVSGFLTPGGRLQVPQHITNDMLLDESLHPQWPCTSDGNPVRDAMMYLEYGKDNYWTSEKMVDHAISIALPIFRLAFPGCQALFAFDNASNHCCYKSDALLAAKMNLGPGGKQPFLRETFIHSLGRPQTMVWPDTASIPSHLRGKQKGIMQVLKERKLWPENGRRSDGFNFLLECPVDSNRTGCKPEGGCCARTVLSAEPDFQQQKGRLQEELECRGQLVIFYPKFHCELNFIERYWCGCKWYARENCQYTLEGLRETVPEALNSVPSATIHRHYLHCLRIINAYASGAEYGSREFKEWVYKAHRQVVDKSKW